MLSETAFGCRQLMPPAGVAADIYVVALDSPATPADELISTLSRDERDRASRFLFDQDRRRFVRARAALRAILAERLDASPVELAFSYGPRGKPSLAGRAAGSLSFNLSHSRELAMIAVAPGRIEVGIDVEWIRKVSDSDAIARRHFAPGEVERWRALPADQRDAAFFRCWTRKEAFVKATGDGLSRSLAGFEVEFGDEAPPSLRVSGDDAQSARWRLAAIDAADGYAAALVASGG